MVPYDIIFCVRFDRGSVVVVTNEYDLDCATCGSALTKREIAATTLGFSAPGEVEIAECSECGGRYFPDATLRRLST